MSELSDFDPDTDSSESTIGFHNFTGFRFIFNGLKSLKMDHNHTTLNYTEAEYQRIVSDIWISIILIALIIAIVSGLCLCFLYDRFKTYRHRYYNTHLQTMNNSEQVSVDLEKSDDYDYLPNYTLVSGLPSYDDFIKQFNRMKTMTSMDTTTTTLTDIGINSKL